MFSKRHSPYESTEADSSVELSLKVKSDAQIAKTI